MTAGDPTAGDPTPAAPSLDEEVQAWVEANWGGSLTVRAWWRRLVDQGYAFPMWPSGLGGARRSSSEARSITAVLGRNAVVAPPAGILASTLAAPTLLEHATPEQLEELLGPIALGEASWCQLFSEPGSGSDLASVAARAVRDGDEWVVSGQKVWSSSADEADMGMLLTRTDPDQPKHRGITYLAVDMHQAGVEVRPLRIMSGQAPFCEVFLDEARVPVRHTIGAVGDGWRVARSTLAAERAMVSAGAAPGLVPARSGRGGDLDLNVGEVVERARHRATGRRRPIRGGAVPAKLMLQLARDHGVDTCPVVRQRLASYWSQVKVDTWTNQRAVSARGRLTGADGSISKLATSRICQQSRDLAYAIAGAHLLLSGADSPLGGDLQTVNLASPGNRLGGGSDEIQLDLIAERALGLPREPRRDDDVPYRDLQVGTRSTG